MFSFKEYTIVPSRCEVICLKAKAFRTEYNLTVLEDRQGRVRPETLIHDWLHFELGFSSSRADEDKLSSAEYEILKSAYEPCTIDPAIVQEYKHAYLNLFEIERLNEIIK